MRACLKYLKDKDLKDLTVAEIGVHNGQNASELMNELDLSVIYLVDPYVAYVDKEPEHWFIYDSIMVDSIRAIAESNISLRPDGYKAKFIRMPSLKAMELFPDNMFDFVYIDALHSHPHVDNDINVWYNKVKTGGVLGGHDWALPDVKEAVRKFTYDNQITIDETLFETDWYIQK